ncbi:DUF1223 domain-containing protein [Pseudaestuariivita rosea]|uniref:DUF1223 domain-containing protein n=1 Tax=Pseudaestuariivita rosea TaxID=2763263 RepID=UPI001ABA51EE|nr:DUF1223 domain-containing protein [Pseudaestuariivita rosea]
MQRFFLGIAGLWIAMTAALHAETRPVVVELYTSQGCSSCPPADKLLHEMAERDHIIPLALHVDYWDYIGWKDSFANPAHTKRQKAYARVAGSRTVYTPQMIIGGSDHVIGTRPMQAMDMIRKHLEAETPVQLTLKPNGGQITIEAISEVNQPMIVQLVRYTPSARVKITRGENRGKTLRYTNIVTSWDVIANWNGADPYRTTIQASGDDPVVVIVQKDDHGAILAAGVIKDR